MKSEQFRLSNKKELQTSSIEFEIVLVDATEQPVERPQKNSGSVTAAKKCHTQKAQMIADGKDFQLFKESGVELPPHVLLLADAGY